MALITWSTTWKNEKFTLNELKRDEKGKKEEGKMRIEHYMMEHFSSKLIVKKRNRLERDYYCSRVTAFDGY